MARTEAVRYAFNRGMVSPRAIARVDLKRMAFSAEEQTNWISRSIGSMMLRPGWAYLGASASNAAARFLPFIAALDSMALLEFTNAALRIWISDALLSRVAVTSAVANGNFDANLGSWTDSDEAGGVSAWETGGYMGLTGNGTAAAIRDQQVTVAAGDQNKEHALRIVIQRGPVILRVGSAAGGDQYITETELGTGTHSLAFTPTGDFHIRFMSRLKRIVLVDSCNVEGSGVVSLTSPYLAADLDNIRGDPDSQSVDVLFIACSGYQQRKVERRSARSWSIVLYQPNDGPFRTANTDPMTMAVSVLSGNGTLTASQAFFRTTHVGALFTVTSLGQAVTVSVTAQNQFSNAIRITGVGGDRVFTIEINSAGAGTTIRLQRSMDSDSGPWSDVSGKSWTTATSEGYNDALDNQIAWYRIGCKTGEYGAGTIGCTLGTLFGSFPGICRVTSYTSTTIVNIEVLEEFGGTVASSDWAEGRWSDYRGWPTAGTFYEGRIWWTGRDRIQGSISDQFDGFDQDTEGDSGPIDRSIGAGPLTTISWILPLQRLLIGAQTAEFSARSTAFDEPLTPTNFNCKPASTQGSYGVAAVKVDSRGLFVQRGGTRVFELAFSPETYDYSSTDLSLLVPEIGKPHIVRIAVQRQPDTRLHCVRSDGTAAMLVHDKTEQVLCWFEVDTIAYNVAGAVVTTGYIEDVIVLPGAVGAEEDSVYYHVKRTVNGSTVRYLEKWALESECEGGTLNKQADSFVSFTNSPAAASIPAGTCSHLVGASVIVWADGKCLKDVNGEIARFTVAADGSVASLTHAGAAYSATTGIVGLHYRGRWKSAKLGQALSKHKNIDHLAPILMNTHPLGIKFGPDYDNMDALPLMYQSSPVNTDTVYSEYDEESQEFPGTWDTDARLYMEANAPRPCTLLAVVVDGQVNG